MLLIDVMHATQDADLGQRIVAAAALAGEGDPESWAWANRWRLAAAPIDDTDKPLADIWGYARDGAHLDRPGLDPTVVTDQHIMHAVAHVRGQV